MVGQMTFNELMDTNSLLVKIQVKLTLLPKVLSEIYVLILSNKQYNNALALK